MEIIDQLRKAAESFGWTVGEEELREHEEFAREIEEHIFLKEGGEIVEKIGGTVLMLSTRGGYDDRTRLVCVTLVSCILARCEKEDPEFALAVRFGIKEVAKTLFHSIAIPEEPKGEVAPPKSVH